MSQVVRTASRFEIALDGGETAFADYEIAGDSIVFPHTVTPKAYQGRGLASQLAEAALAYARDQGLKVRPHCGFFRAYIAKRPDLHDWCIPTNERGSPSFRLGLLVQGRGRRVAGPIPGWPSRSSLAGPRDGAVARRPIRRTPGSGRPRSTARGSASGA